MQLSHQYTKARNQARIHLHRRHAAPVDGHSGLSDDGEELARGGGAGRRSAPVLVAGGAHGGHVGALRRALIADAELRAAWAGKADGLGECLLYCLLSKFHWSSLWPEALFQVAASSRALLFGHLQIVRHSHLTVAPSSNIHELRKIATHKHPCRAHSWSGPPLTR